MKQRGKQIAALLMALLLILAMAGCGALKNKKDEIIVAYYVNSTISDDLDKVENAINAITEEKIQVSVKLLPISMGTYNEQINLMLSSGEPLDLFMMNGTSFSTYVSKGQCIALNDLLQEYGQGILETVGTNLLKGGSIHGEIYGVMPMRDIAQGAGFFIRRDYVEKYDLDLSAVRSLEDVEPILATIKNAEPTLFPLIIENNDTLTPVELLAGKDNVSDGFGVLLAKGDPYTILDYYESDAYQKACETMRRWFQAGFISPDASTGTENIATQMKAGTGVCYFYMTKTGIDVQESKANNHEMVHVQILPPYISTAKAQLLTWGVAQQSRNPEAAVKFLNLLYTDKDVLNLIDWGLENIHYVFTEDGHITYPEGVDSSNSGYNLNMSWAFGTQFNSYVWEGNDLNIWEDSKRAVQDADVSPTMGFTFDSEPVKTEISALNNVAAEFRMGLESGSLDSSYLDQFVQKLKAAGIDKVVEEKQRQLDLWREANQ